MTCRTYLLVRSYDMYMYFSFLSVMIIATGQISILSLGRDFDVVSCYMYLLLWRGSVLGSGTAPQTGRSWVWFPMVSLEILRDNPSGHTMAPRSAQPLRQKWILVISPGQVKEADNVITFKYQLSWSQRSLNFLENSRPVQGLPLTYCYRVASCMLSVRAVSRKETGVELSEI
jgi:hypothetical protein